MRGTQEKKLNFVKIFFRLCINRNTQERKLNFVKNILHGIISGSTQEKNHPRAKPFQQAGDYRIIKLCLIRKKMIL